MRKTFEPTAVIVQTLHHFEHEETAAYIFFNSLITYYQCQESWRVITFHQYCLKAAHMGDVTEQSAADLTQMCRVFPFINLSLTRNEIQTNTLTTCYVLVPQGAFLQLPGIHGNLK